MLLGIGFMMLFGPLERYPSNIKTEVKQFMQEIYTGIVLDKISSNFMYTRGFIVIQTHYSFLTSVIS